MKKFIPLLLMSVMLVGCIGVGSGPATPEQKPIIKVIPDPRRFIETDSTKLSFSTVHMIEDSVTGTFYLIVEGDGSNYPISITPRIESALDNKSQIAIADSLKAVADQLKESNRLAAEQTKLLKNLVSASGKNEN